ncbi:kinase-like domain, phloem protein 2-like protein [Tanacetum coccineum]
MMSSPNHDDLLHFKIPLADILSATNNFVPGKLIDIEAQRWNKEWDDKEQQFWMEIFMLFTLKHKNLVSFVGFCDENDEKIIIIKLETRGSLDYYLSDPMSLTWVRRLEICVSVAHALSYLHYDEHSDFSFIHRNIESGTILLNDNWEPKLCEFRLSMKIEASQRHDSFHVDKVWDRKGYTDPAYLETKRAHHMSDLYSFGILMFELLCGRKSVVDHQDNKVSILEYVKDESKRFWTEVSMLSSLKHKNLVSLIGFYENVNNKIIIYKKEAKQNLKTYLSDQTLTWMQRLKICIGARLNFTCWIEWEPKLSGFELSLKNTVARRQHLLLTRDIVKNVYLDPKYKTTGGVTHKSDVYSLAYVFIRVLRGKECSCCIEELGEGLISQLEKSHLDGMVDPHLQKQMDPESFRIFSETTYYCLQEERAKRPYIDQVVKRLDKALELQWKHENPVRNFQRMQLRWKDLEHLKIGLNHIELATENFDEKYCIGSGGYGMVYKAQLEHFDSSISSPIDGENKCDLPKKQSTVAIKRIFNTQGEQGFISEIETLTSCKHLEYNTHLLGFCDEVSDHDPCLNELASKGSLEDYMETVTNMTNLTSDAHV